MENKTFELTVLDRWMIKNIIPDQVNMLKGMLFRSIEKKVSFSPEEITRLNLLDNKTILNDITETFTIYFEESELSVLRERIDELDKAGSIPFQAIDICYKIKGKNV